MFDYTSISQIIKDTLFITCFIPGLHKRILRGCTRPESDYLASWLTSLVLLGTYKITGYAAGLALALFNQQTTLPSTVYTIIMLTTVVIYDLKRAHNNVN